MRRETARLLKEEAQILETLNQVGTAVSAEIELDRAVQVVTDAATRLSGAAFGSFFYNVIDDKGEVLHALHPVRRAARGVREIPDAAQHRGVRAHLQRRGHRPLGRHHQGSALRQERALFRHAQGASAGVQLPRGAGDLAHRRGSGRAVLRPSAARRFRRSRRAHRGGHRRPGRDRHRQGQALPRRAGRDRSAGGAPKRRCGRASRAWKARSAYARRSWRRPMRG